MEWYGKWCSSHPTSDTIQQCDKWFTTDGSVKHEEDFNGQKRYRYTQQQAPPTEN